MLANQEVRNWVSALVVFIIFCAIFGSDLLFFNKAGATVDVALIVGAVGTLGLPASFTMGKQMAVSNLTANKPQDGTDKKV